MNAPKPKMLELDAQLLADAEAAGIDAPTIAARAIRRALKERDRERIRREIGQEIEWYNAFVAEHGSFAEIIRAEFGEEDDAPTAV